MDIKWRSFFKKKEMGKQNKARLVDLEGATEENPQSIQNLALASKDVLMLSFLLLIFCTSASPIDKTMLPIDKTIKGP